MGGVLPATGRRWKRPGLGWGRGEAEQWTEPRHMVGVLSISLHIKIPAAKLQ